MHVDQLSPVPLREEVVNHTLVRSAHRIASQSYGKAWFLQGPRGEERPLGEPVWMFNSFEEDVPAGKLCIALEGPPDDFVGARWEILCVKSFGLIDEPPPLFGDEFVEEFAESFDED